MAKKKEFSFRAPIKHAFEELTALGYFAKENHTCCQSCGWAEAPEGAEKVVFYHNQDLDNLKDDGGCYLSWAGNGKEIVDVLEKHGLVVKWNGNDGTRIHMQLQKKDVATREIVAGKTKYRK
jgi:hypothetical protein